jgi:hypothetical protein
LLVGEVPGLPTVGFPGVVVPAGVVIGVPVASLVTAFGFGVAGLPALGALVGLPAAGVPLLVGAAGATLLPHKLTKSKVVPLVVSI